MRLLATLLPPLLLVTAASAQCFSSNPNPAIPAYHLAFGSGCTAQGESGPMMLTADFAPISPPSSQPPFTVLGTLVTYTLTNVPPVVPGTYLTVLVASFHPIQAGVSLDLFFPGNDCMAYVATLDITRTQVDNASPVDHMVLIPADIVPVLQMTIQGVALTSTLDMVTSNALCAYINNF